MSDFEKRLAQLSPAKRALLEMQMKSSEPTADKAEPIAIIGMGCRFPGAEHPQAFWRMMSEGVDAISDVPSERWDADAFFSEDPQAPGKMYTRWGGFVPDIDKFDARFFGISPREAMTMDPQQRLLLEVTWEALANAGQVPDQLSGSRTGVFVGICTDEYARLHYKSGDPLRIDPYCGTGSTFSVAGGRLSYLLGLQGPNIALDTACSSSLVTVHLACQSLKNKESDMAIAGGVNIILLPEGHIYFCKLQVMAKDGRCKTFDNAADGYVRGEGCGVVVLKRYADAVRDNDHILALICGSAVNHDGPSTGLTVPNGPAQQTVIREALHNAAIDPLEVDYVETHGTGTALGDPIEIGALETVLCKGRTQPLTIGSVKTNFGHLEAAAGIAGLLKVVLCLQHREIPPHLHLKQRNAHVNWDNLPIEIPVHTKNWELQGKQRIAGVSSFGFSGTNAHVVLREAPATPVTPQDKSPSPSQLLPISAHSHEALRDYAQRYRQFLGAQENISATTLRDICYTAAVRRSHYAHRLTIVGNSPKQFVDGLTAFLHEDKYPHLAYGVKPATHRSQLVFVFSGQGAHWLGMASKLCEREPVFRDSMEKCEQIMKQFVDWSLCEQLHADEQKSRLQQTNVMQPMVFAIQVSLAALWNSWGVKPKAVVGHSMGEVAASYVAGILSLEEAVRIICRRSLLMSRASGQGAMAMVELPVEKARQAIVDYEDTLSIAAGNSPTSTVLSGEPAALKVVVATLEHQDVFCQFIKVDVACHSQQMEPLREELVQELQDLQPQKASIPMYSTVLGQVVVGTECNAEYWGQNLRNPVMFANSIAQLLADNYDIFIEISPHAILSLAIQQTMSDCEQQGVVLPSMRRQEQERLVMLESLGRLYTLGYNVAWPQLYPNAGNIVDLPPYPWQRERFWLENAPLMQADGRRTPSSHLKDEPEAKEYLYDLVWKPQALPEEDEIKSTTRTWLVLADHQGVGEQLAKELRKQGECTLIFADREYKAVDAHNYHIDPQQSEDWSRLFGELLKEEKKCSGVIHLWSLDSTPALDLTLPTLEQAQTLGCASVLQLILHLAPVEWTSPPHLWLVTRGAQRIVDEVPEIAQAPLWGIANVIPVEHRELWGGLVDLDPQADADVNAGQLLRELSTTATTDRIAFRSEKRYVARVVSKTALPKLVPKVRVDASYLVSGGLGDLGLLTAELLIEQGARRLVLIGRTQLPPRSEWHAVDPQSSSGRKIAALKRLERMGACIHTPCFDIADSEQLTNFWEQFHQQDYPPIRGIVHAAVVLADRMLVQTDRNALQTVLRAKMLGSWLLHTLTQDQELDFFIVFSSLSSLMGVPGHGSYAAANAFLDVLAHYRQAKGLPALAINWGRWSNMGTAETEGGRRMADYVARRGIDDLETGQGKEILQKLLAQKDAQLVVMPLNWSKFRAYQELSQELILLSDLLQQQQQEPSLGERKGYFRETLLATEQEQQLAMLTSHIGEQVAKVFKLDPSELETDAPLRDFGLDSIMGLEIRNQLEMSLGLTLPGTLVWRCPTVRDLAGHLLGKLALEEEATPDGQPQLETSEDVDDMVEILQNVGDLSQDDLQQLLEDESSTKENSDD